DIGRSDLLDQAEADHRWRQARRQSRARVERAIAQALDRIAGLAQRNDGAVAQHDLLFRIADAHASLAAEAWNREILQLRATNRIGKVQHLVVGERCLLFRAARIAREPQEHRSGACAALRRTAATVLEVAILAGAYVE